MGAGCGEPITKTRMLINRVDNRAISRVFRAIRRVMHLMLDGILVLTVTTCGNNAAAPTPGASAGSTPAAVISAVITQVHGTVTIAENSAAGQSVRRALPMQILRLGATLTIPTSGQVGLICSNERWISLTGEAAWQLTEAACSSGRPLPPGSYGNLAPETGRIRSVDTSKVLESSTRERERDYGAIPVVLSPRNTSLMNPRPDIRWTAVEQAVEYQVELTGPNTVAPIVIDANKLACAPAKDSPLATCSLAFPAHWHALDPGKTYFFVVSARLGVASPWRKSEATVTKILPQDQAERVTAEVTAIRSLTLDEMTYDLLLGSTYAQHGLYDDTIAAYEHALAAQPAPAIYVGLGDVYRAIKLYRFAFANYTAALKRLDPNDLAVRAAAEFGIGQVYYTYMDYQQALPHFQQAAQLYAQLGLMTERDAAAKAAAEAQQRIGTPNTP